MKSATKRKILRKTLSLTVTLSIVLMLYYSGNTDEQNNQLILEAKAQAIEPVYWSYISDTILGASTIFGGLVTMVIRIAAVLIVLTVVFFITTTLDSVMGSVKSKLK